MDKFTRRKIVIENELAQKREVNISELSSMLNVSEVTVRRDLKKLEMEGVLIRSYKGAVLATNEDTVDDSIRARMLENQMAKEIICKFAANMIKDDDVIMLDASTSALHLCKYIRNRKLTVVTNSIYVATTLCNANEVTVIMVGGILRKDSMSLIGQGAIDELKKLNIGKAFISGKALSYNDGLTDINMLEIDTKKAAIAKSGEVVVLVDHHKLNKVSLQKVCGSESISKIIIDGLTPFSSEEEKTLKSFQNDGIEVIIAK